MKEYLFVCGTLLPGRAPAALQPVMAEMISLGSGSMPGRLYDLGPYPAGIFDKMARSRVHGWVFDVPDADRLLRRLDEYEGIDPARAADGEYVRVPRPITLADGAELTCWVYLYNRDEPQHGLIPGGDYAAHLRAH